MHVKLISHTENPEKTIASAAKLCYSSKASVDDLMKDLTPKSVDKFIKHLIEIGHESPLEHASFTFAIEGVSRSLTHQLVRHRLASYSQRSQRYCSESESEFVIPSTIMNNTSAAREYGKLMSRIGETYNQLIAWGIPKEDARYILPNACTTRIIVTMNLREYLHFFNERCCTRAQWEIRELAFKMLKILQKDFPLLFNNAGAKCVKGYCPEGSMSCGKYPTLDKFLTKNTVKEGD